MFTGICEQHGIKETKICVKTSPRWGDAERIDLCVARAYTGDAKMSPSTTEVVSAMSSVFSLLALRRAYWPRRLPPGGIWQARERLTHWLQRFSSSSSEGSAHAILRSRQNKHARLSFLRGPFLPFAPRDALAVFWTEAGSGAKATDAVDVTRGSVVKGELDSVDKRPEGAC